MKVITIAIPFVVGGVLGIMLGQRSSETVDDSIADRRPVDEQSEDSAENVDVIGIHPETGNEQRLRLKASIHLFGKGTTPSKFSIPLNGPSPETGKTYLNLGTVKPSVQLFTAGNANDPNHCTWHGTEARIILHLPERCGDCLLEGDCEDPMCLSVDVGC